MTLVHVVGAAIVADGRCLVAQRGAEMELPLKWEFPGGKVEPGELPEDALARELREELGVIVRVGNKLGEGESLVAGRVIHLDVYLAHLVHGTPRPVEHCAIRWVGASELAAMDWADADVPIVAAVKQRLGRPEAASSDRSEPDSR